MLIRRDYPNALGADAVKALVEDFGANEKFIEFDYQRYASANLSKLDPEGARAYLTPLADPGTTVQDLFTVKQLTLDTFNNPAFHIDYERIREEERLRRIEDGEEPEEIEEDTTTRFVN